MELNCAPTFAGEKAKEVYETVMETAKTTLSHADERKKRLEKFLNKLKHNS